MAVVVAVAVAGAAAVAATASATVVVVVVVVVVVLVVVVLVVVVMQVALVVDMIICGVGSMWRNATGLKHFLQPRLFFLSRPVIYPPLQESGSSSRFLSPQRVAILTVLELGIVEDVGNDRCGFLRRLTKNLQPKRTAHIDTRKMLSARLYLAASIYAERFAACNCGCGLLEDKWPLVPKNLF